MRGHGSRDWSRRRLLLLLLLRRGGSGRRHLQLLLLSLHRTGSRASKLLQRRRWLQLRLALHRRMRLLLQLLQLLLLLLRRRGHRMLQCGGSDWRASVLPAGLGLEVKDSIERKADLQ